MPKSTALAVTDDVPQRIAVPRYKRVSRQLEGLILKLAESGKSQTETAQIVGVSQATVSRTLAEFADTRSVAKAILHRGASTLAERIVKSANVVESLDVLERIEVVAPKKSGESHGPAALVVVNMPGQSSIRAEDFALSLPAFASLAPSQGAASD